MTVEEDAKCAQLALIEIRIKTKLELTVEDHVLHVQLVMITFRIKMKAELTAVDHALLLVQLVMIIS